MIDFSNLSSLSTFSFLQMCFSNNNITETKKIYLIRKYLKDMNNYLDDTSLDFFIRNAQVYGYDFWYIICKHKNSKLAYYLLFWKSACRVSTTWYHPELTIKDVIDYKFNGVDNKAMKKLDELYDK
jgi:hypothetical protein